jgi:tetratricopeptide (TPR) repeat protein
LPLNKRPEVNSYTGVAKAAKETLGVVIMTSIFKIVGDVHIYENARLSDMLNVDTNKKDFIPVTNAQVFKIHDPEVLLYKKGFLSVNRNFIVMIHIDDSSLKALTDIIRLGHKFLMERKYDDALHEAKRAVAINSNDAEAHFLLGMALAKKNMLTEAWEEFKLASAYAPKNSEVEHQALEMLSRIKV